MTPDSHWSVLEIEPTTDTKIIRKRYAKLLKTIDQKAHPEKFQELREAYERALHAAMWMAHEQAQQEQAEAESAPEVAAPIESNNHASGQIISETDHSAPRDISTTIENNAAQNERPVEISLTGKHLEKWAGDITTLIKRGDTAFAGEALTQHLKSALCEHRNTWQQYQKIIINLCLHDDKIPYAFVTSAAEQFGWFDPALQGETFNEEHVRAMRAHILQQDAINAVSEIRNHVGKVAEDILRAQLNQDRLQGLNERDYFEACLLVQSIHFELPLPAMQIINTTLGWDKENGHLWSLAPQACADFRDRMQYLINEQSEHQFERHVRRIAANESEVSSSDQKKLSIWPYVLVPLILSLVLALSLVLVMESKKPVAGTIFLFLIFISIIGVLSRKKFVQNRVLHHPLADIVAVRNLLSSYRPIWLRRRAFDRNSQQRTKDWLNAIETRYPKLAERLDQKTLQFWRKKWPAADKEKIALYFVVSLPVSGIFGAFLGNVLGDLMQNGLPFCVISGMLGMSAVQCYLFAALPVWCEPALKKTNAFFAKWIVPKRFQELPNRGMSCIQLIMFSTLIGIIVAGFSFMFELDLRDSAWISGFIVLPLSVVLSGWIYLWRYERNLGNSSMNTAQSNSKTFEFRWWHGLLIVSILNAIGNRHS